MTNEYLLKPGDEIEPVEMEDESGNGKGRPRYCLECGRPFREPGRSDRKFCSTHCHNLYHNRITRASRNMKVKVLNALEKNYKILQRIMRLKLSHVTVPELVSAGFKPDYMTYFHKSGRHREYRCFDIEYCMTDNKLFLVRRVNTDIMLDEKSGTPDESCRFGCRLVADDNFY